MQARLGNHVFLNVGVPLLWGGRAVIEHSGGELSIIDLGGEKAIPEIVSDKPWVGVEYIEKEDGYLIYKENMASYFYSPIRKIIRDVSGGLPECEFGKDKIRIGTSTVSSSTIIGMGVGIGVTESGFYIGGPLPSGLANLVF